MFKTSQVISYRLSERELEALLYHQHKSESLNQTAQRLLRETINLSVQSSYTATSTLSTSYVDNRVAAQLAPLRIKLTELEAALEEFVA